jgi:hypothetical protein
MRFCNNVKSVIVGLLFSGVLLLACGGPKEGKVLITDQEFSIRTDSDNSWVVDAKGKVKNVGNADVKNIVVTGFCKSCSKVFSSGKWFVSKYEKMPDQKDTIDYLPVGVEKTFGFKGIAFIMEKNGKAPSKMPVGLECEIVSFETVGN